MKRSRARRPLSAYRGKRSAARTPEPFGSGSAERPGLFVVQHHAARRTHFDFRLAWRGVLLSWAVPRGPSLDPSERRLAVRVEDHPLEYADFEGVIPPGNYGAGAVIVWDRGRWLPAEDPDAGLRKGKLAFDLEGYKLRGRWALVRTGRRSERAEAKEWLLLKKPDPYARRGPDGRPSEESVLSGLTLDELMHGSRRAETVRHTLNQLDAPRRTLHAAQIRPMLAEARSKPFSGKGWVFEVKYDGFRAIGAREHGRARLYYRSGKDATALYPEIATALTALPYEHLVLDGELLATDSEGRPSFQGIQHRAQLHRSRDIERAAVERPVTYFVFDLLGFEDTDLRLLPLVRRKALLESLLPGKGPVRYAPHFEARGEEVYAQIEKLGLEGMVAKKADAPYRSGRSSLWQKIRALRTVDLVVVGFTAPKRSRSGFGALHLAGYVGDDLVYAGRVGSGFSEQELDEIRTALEPRRRRTPPCAGTLPSSKHSTWVEPERVCEVRYAEVTQDGLLRQPVFLRLRDDKPTGDCSLPVAASESATVDAPAPPKKPRVREKPTVAFTNLDKVFWPNERYTKGDLLDYYRTVSPWLLPYLRDRPLVLTRYPDGIEGKSFFQKDAPQWTPPWVRTQSMWSEHGGREIRYFVCDDLASLLYVVNLGAIPLHVWSSRIARLQQPDWCILDLDPKGAPMSAVVRVARAIRTLCTDIGLPSFVKTSGSTGLHVLIPLEGQLTYGQSRTLGELIARVVERELPKIATVARALAARRGRVYLDYLQNGHGRLLVAPLSARPLPGAPVSMPLRWSEVTSRLDIARFHIRSAPTRLRRMKKDPLRPVLEITPDLARALGRLEKRLANAR